MGRMVDIELRRAYGRALGTLTRDVGSLSDAEDVLHEAVTRALSRWPTAMPDNPSAWLIRVARNVWIDQKRRETVHRNWQDSEVLSEFVEPSDTHVDDDLLRLVFTCCHPALSSTAKNTLTLRYVLGFTSDEISRAYLTSKSTVEKRLVRAKSKIKDAGIEYEVPRPKHLQERLASVCEVLYLLFNEGYSVLNPERDIDLCREAIRLTRHVARMFREEETVHSLLALFLLHHSRISQRVNSDGVFMPLSEQDRSQWNHAEIQEGLALLDRVFLKRKLPSAYQLQAAISAEHCRVDNSADTRWDEIVSLYDYLDKHYPSPVITLNRAIAVAYSGNLSAANALLCQVESQVKLTNYPPYFAARAFVDEKLGDLQSAIGFYKQAVASAPTLPERRYLQKQLDRITTLSLVS